jgi:hypothetical protein
MITCSRKARGTSDNPVVESFFNLRKRERIRSRKYKIHQDARQ